MSVCIMDTICTRRCESEQEWSSERILKLIILPLDWSHGCVNARSPEALVWMDSRRQGQRKIWDICTGEASFAEQGAYQYHAMASS